MQDERKGDPVKLYYENAGCKFFKGDSTKDLTSLPERKFDLIYADPPYFLSTGGVTCRSGKPASNTKGEWDKYDGYDEINEFNSSWILQVKNILRKSGSLWISGTYHNIYSVGYILKTNGFWIVQDIIWFKPDAPPAIMGKNFRASHENLIWSINGKGASKTFNYQLMKNWDVDCDLIGREGKQMRSVWAFSTGYMPNRHPTQKPVELLSRIIGACSNEGDNVLDPFLGSGTTAVVCKQRGRLVWGVEKEEEYLEMAIRRYEETEYLGDFKPYNEGLGKWIE